MSHITQIVREQLQKAFSCCEKPIIIYEDIDYVTIQIEDEIIIFKQLILLMSVSECHLLFKQINVVTLNRRGCFNIIYEKKGF
jgi:hypothetical protein